MVRAEREAAPAPDPAGESTGAAGPRPPAWVWAALVVLAALASLYRSDDNDYWFHLAAGRSIAEHGLPSRETWCLAALGEKPWLSEWLFHGALFQAHRLAGEPGIALWRAGWTAVAMALAIGLLFRIGAASWTAVLLAPLVLATSRDRFQPRPEQIFLVLVLLHVLLFETARRTGKDRTRWLVPAQILWANAHGSWVFGQAIAWLYAAADAWERFRSRSGASAADGSRPAADAAASSASGPVPRAAYWAGLGLALWIASAVVPSPLETLAVPFRFLVDRGVDPLTGAIEELRPWSWRADRGEPFTALLLLWLLALLVGGARIFRSSPALGALALAGFALGMFGFRFRGLAAWLGWAPLALALAPAGSRLPRVAALVPAGAAAALGIAWLLMAPQFTFGIRPHLYAVPVRAAALADSLGLPGPVLNTFHHGGYLLWVRGEGHPPLIDGRGRGSLAFRSLYARAHGDAMALDSLLEAWDFDHILVQPPQFESDRLATELARRLEWARIFQDDAGVLFVRWSRYPEIARQRAYRYVTPDYLEMMVLSQRSLADDGLRKLVEAELMRARAESPWHARSSLWLGLLALSRRDAPAAVRFLDEAERIAPATPGLALRQGMAREMAGDVRGARQAYRRALRDPEDAVMARASLKSLRR